jgi:glyoxylase-like metal-dependent hydrolase (beta-lactamase superfamily II)
MKLDASHIYMIAGAGSNIVVDTFPEGVLLVDTGSGKMDAQVLTEIRKVASDPAIHYIIDTSADPDHVGGNMSLSKHGNQFTGGNVAAAISDASVGAEIIAHQTVQDRLSGVTESTKALPEGMWPTTTYESPILKLSTKYHGDAVELLHEPAAHSDGDTVVWFRISDVLVTGEIFSTTNYPVIDIDKGGSINGEIKALNQLLDVAFPFFRMEDGTMIVPARGRICDSTDLAYYRDMVTIIRDRVQYMIDKGKPLDEIKAAKLTADYDPDYAVNDIGYTPDMFVEAVYKSLIATKKDK